MSLEKYAKQSLTRHDSIGWASAQYLEALAHLRQEMLIGGEELAIAQFNVGDRVRLWDGAVGTLAHIGMSSVYYVRLENGGMTPISHNEFAELADDEVTK